MAHRTAMGTKMAAAFANIFMARIENKSCIEPDRGHRRIFIACSGMLRLQADRSLSEGRSHTRGEAARKNAFRVGHYKDFAEPDTAHKKSLGT